MSDDKIYITFKNDILKSKLKILSIFHKTCTFWFKLTKCEIVSTIDIVVCFSLPFIKTNATEVFNCSLTIELLNISLENTIADEITLIFDKNKVIATSEKTCSNISCFNLEKLINSEEKKTKDEWASVEKYSDESEDECNENNIKPIKQGENIFFVTIIAKDEYRFDNNNIAYNVNLNDYSNIVFRFRISQDTLSSIIKKFIISKASNIRVKIQSNSIVFTTLRTDTVNKSELTVCLLSNSLKSNKIMFLDLKYFALLKKLTISVGNGKLDNNKEKKIYKELEFNGVIKNKTLAGFSIYPALCTEKVASEFFIFMPLSDSP